MARSPREVPLAGGNMNTVVRVGDRVHRTSGAWTETVQRLLAHLRFFGVSGIPEPFGLDSIGREVVGYLDGEVPQYPMPNWVWADAVLADTGRLLRSIHDASLDFDRADATWQVAVHEPAEVICHNDFAPYNLVFQGGSLTGVIDFDTASPGPRVWDLAYLAYRLVPLASPGGARENTVPLAERARRIRVLVDAYASDTETATDEPAHSITSERLVSVAIDRLLELADFSDERARILAKPELHRHAARYRAHAAELALSPGG